MEHERGPDTQVVQMFEEISPTYDFVNRLCSLRLDVQWRRLCVRALDVQLGQVVLDCAAGTGDMAAEVCRRAGGIHAVLVDPAAKMLVRARQKLARFPEAETAFIKASAEELPFATETFDRIVVAFGIRNFQDLDGGLAELFRVTRRSGRGAILEFTPDRNAVFQGFFHYYFSHVIRPVGALISGNRNAYDYLQKSIADFPTSSEICHRLAEVGWTVSVPRKLAGGVATLFMFEKRVG
jgi:demethylmenaquinone methyltransferase/2-methoxy-6-polyprenyl-1,4-benzoquinol methylase